MINIRGINGEVHCYFTFVVRVFFLGMIWILLCLLTLWVEMEGIALV